MCDCAPPISQTENERMKRIPALYIFL
jgi:hypothetical protein